MVWVTYVQFSGNCVPMKRNLTWWSGMRQRLWTPLLTQESDSSDVLQGTCWQNWDFSICSFLTDDKNYLIEELKFISTSLKQSILV